MARVRRKTSATARWNLEIAGIVALGFAMLLGIALVAPPARTGVVGGATAFALHAMFGAGAAFFVVLIALVAAIVFLEINVPRMIATLGGAACAYFILVDTVFAAAGRDGGMLGGLLHRALHALVGDAGVWIVLVVAFVAVTVAITGVSLKKVIGWCATLLAALRVPPALEAAVCPAWWRDAFHLPELRPGSQSGASAAVAAPGLPAPAQTVVETPPVRFYDQELAEDDAADSDDDEYEDEADDDAADEADAYDEDDAYDDEDDEDDEIADEPDDGAPGDVESGVQDRFARAALTGEVLAPEPARPAYRLPDVAAIFDAPQAQKTDDASRAHVLEDTLASFGVGAKVTHIERGPSITRYELRPERGVKISRISSLADDIALALAATSVRIEAPIPGQSAVGLPVFGDLAKMPHLLVAGATGAGKSVCLNCIIASLLVTATPDQLELLMIDPKRVELTMYNGIPHLKNEVITDPSMAAGALAMITREMDQRYERFAREGVRKNEEYNAKFPDEKLPYIVVIIDELADLMLVAPAKVVLLVIRRAQLSRATWIQHISVTQRT